MELFLCQVLSESRKGFALGMGDFQWKAHGNRKKSALQVHNIQMSFT